MRSNWEFWVKRRDPVSDLENLSGRNGRLDDSSLNKCSLLKCISRLLLGCTIRQTRAIMAVVDDAFESQQSFG